MAKIVRLAIGIACAVAFLMAVIFLVRWMMNRFKGGGNRGVAGGAEGGGNPNEAI